MMVFARAVYILKKKTMLIGLKEKNYFLNLLKIIKAEIYKKEINQNLIPGKLFLYRDNLLLKLTSGILKIDEVRLEGKKTMKSLDFVKGNKIFKISSVD